MNKHKLLLADDKIPYTIQEIVYRLKIKDAMSKNIVTVGTETSLQEIKQMMRDNGITGIPVVNGHHLEGMITIGDLIVAMENNNLTDKVTLHMERSLVILEEEMPLSFAINYFNKHSFHRFPVVNKDSCLVGIITSRDVLVALLRELDKEVRELEKKIIVETSTVDSGSHLEFVIGRYDFENAGKASFEIKKMLKEKNVSQEIIRRITVAAYELEINIAIHSTGGKIVFTINGNTSRVTAKDNGPGIESVEVVLEEGFSTANDWVRSLGFGAGMGLPNIKRVSDEFDIVSAVGEGTTVTSVVFLK